MQHAKTFLLTTVTALWLALFAALPINVQSDGGDTTLIHACVLNKDGSMRIVSATTNCKNNETPLHWANVARVSAIETKNTAQDGLIATAQSTNNIQNSAISTIQAKDTQQDTAIQALQGQTGGGPHLVDNNGKVIGFMDRVFSDQVDVVNIVTNGVVALFSFDQNGFVETSNSYFTSANCSGPRLLQNFGVSQFSRFGTVINGIGWYAVGPYQTVTFNSVESGGQCFTQSGDVGDVAPAISVDLSVFAPPFHVE